MVCHQSVLQWQLVMGKQEYVFSLLEFISVTSVQWNLRCALNIVTLFYSQFEKIGNVDRKNHLFGSSVLVIFRFGLAQNFLCFRNLLPYCQCINWIWQFNSIYIDTLAWLRITKVYTAIYFSDSKPKQVTCWSEILWRLDYIRNLPIQRSIASPWKFVNYVNYLRSWRT